MRTTTLPRRPDNYVIDQDGYVISRVAARDGEEIPLDDPAEFEKGVAGLPENQGGDFGGGGDADSTPQPSASGSATPPTLYGNWQPALFMPYRRSIGGIVAQVTIEEQASDDVSITEHPVEQGAPIADHAFKRPATIQIRAGWSVTGAYDLSAETGVYGLLLSWQAALLPFDVISGKRRYTNMLMERLVVTTDQKSEYALMADITCRQVIIVGTQESKTKTTSESPDGQETPEKNASSGDKGDQEPKPVGDGGVLKPADPIDPELTKPGSEPAPGSEFSTMATPQTYQPPFTPAAKQIEVVGVANTTSIGNAEKGLARTGPEFTPLASQPFGGV